MPKKQAIEGVVSTPTLGATGAEQSANTTTNKRAKGATTAIVKTRTSSKHISHKRPLFEADEPLKSAAEQGREDFKFHHVQQDRGESWEDYDDPLTERHFTIFLTCGRALDKKSLIYKALDEKLTSDNFKAVALFYCLAPLGVTLNPPLMIWWLIDGWLLIALWYLYTLYLRDIGFSVIEVLNTILISFSVAVAYWGTGMWFWMYLIIGFCLFMLIWHRASPSGIMKRETQEQDRLNNYKPTTSYTPRYKGEDDASYVARIVDLHTGKHSGQDAVYNWICNNMRYYRRTHKMKRRRNNSISGC